MIPAADDFATIRSRMADIAREEGRKVTDLRYARGSELDALAERYDLKRFGYEADDTLRARIETAMQRQR